MFGGSFLFFEDLFLCRTSVYISFSINYKCPLLFLIGPFSFFGKHFFIY